MTTAEETETQVPQTRQPKPVIRASLLPLVSEHKAPTTVAAALAGLDLSQIPIHLCTTGTAQPFLFASLASAAVSVGMLWRVRDAALKTRIKTAKSRRWVQANVKAAVLLGSVWEITAAAWTPFGPHGSVQLSLLGGGLAVAFPYLRRNRRKTQPAQVTEIEAPKVDWRLAQFRDHFCQEGRLQDARLNDLATIRGGFKFTVTPMLARRGTFDDVKRIEREIAALYAVPLDQVAVEHPADRSHRSAVVTVLTEARAHERDEPWDGRSTYDPETGTFILGRFADISRSRYQLHVPGSGATCGIAGGVQGSGKTGTLNVIVSEAGQAKLCIQCGAAASCARCRLERICGLWVGDPQRQPFGVWKGRADLTAWGPLACVRMLFWLETAMRARAASAGDREWTDHLGRKNFGKGWFDPEPGFPMLLGVITEWPMVAKDPELGPYAIEMAEHIGDEGRKVGVGLLFDVQGGDARILGQRNLRNALIAYNAIAHQSDRYLGQMLGTDGCPADLPKGVHGVSYLRGYDKRSDITHRTKHLPEYLRLGQKGVDVREIAQRIADDPIRYDNAVLKAITALGYTGPGQVLTDEDGWDLSRLASAGEPAAEPKIPEPANATADSRRETTVLPVPAAAVSAVRSALDDPAGIEFYDVMAVTGLSARDASKALDTLIDTGYAAQDSTGRYRTAERTSL